MVKPTISKILAQPVSKASNLYIKCVNSTRNDTKHKYHTMYADTHSFSKHGPSNPSWEYYIVNFHKSGLLFADNRALYLLIAGLLILPEELNSLAAWEADW